MAAQLAQVSVSTTHGAAVISADDEAAATLILEERSPIRGIAFAMLLAAPIWMVAALTVYVLH